MEPAAARPNPVSSSGTATRKRDPIVSEPGGPDPIDVAVRGLKDQSHDSLHRHHGQKGCGQTSGEPYWV